MTLDELVTLTRERLAARQRRVVDPGPLVRAAVLVPLVERGGPHMVFAKRTDRVGTHRGQIAFPGGTVSADDASLLAAALRESEEEVGLSRTAVEALGALDDTETFATRFVIRSEEHTSELQSHSDLVCRLLLEKKNAKREPNQRIALLPHNGAHTPDFPAHAH